MAYTWTSEEIQILKKYAPYLSRKSKVWGVLLPERTYSSINSQCYIIKVKVLSIKDDNVFIKEDIGTINKYIIKNNLNISSSEWVKMFDELIEKHTECAINNKISKIRNQYLSADADVVKEYFSVMNEIFTYDVSSLPAIKKGIEMILYTPGTNAFKAISILNEIKEHGLSPVEKQQDKEEIKAKIEEHNSKTDIAKKEPEVKNLTNPGIPTVRMLTPSQYSDKMKDGRKSYNTLQEFFDEFVFKQVKDSIEKDMTDEEKLKKLIQYTKDLSRSGKIDGIYVKVNIGEGMFFEWGKLPERNT